MFAAGVLLEGEYRMLDDPTCAARGYLSFWSPRMDIIPPSPPLKCMQAATGWGKVSMPGYTSGVVQPLPLPPPSPSLPPSPPSPPPPPPLVLRRACGLSTYIDMNLYGSDLQDLIPQDSSAPVPDGVDQCCQTCVNNTDCFAYVFEPTTGNVSGTSIEWVSECCVP